VGDGFHADGRLAEAIEAYRSAANDPVVGGRLCLKIAACWRRARLVERERAWLLAASATAGRGPWSTFGRLGLGRLRSEAHFTRELAAALRIPRERKAAALLAEEEVRIAQRQGRFAFADAGARVVLDHGGALGPATTLYAGIFDSLVSQGRFLEAAREARELADKPSTAASEREVLALEEAYALTMARRTSAAFALTDSITRDASGPRIRMRASHTRAIALRASGRSTQAEEVFRDVARQAPAFGGHEVAIFHLAVLLALRGATEEADLAMGNIRGFESEYAIVGPALLRVIDGDYESACATLDGEIENRTRRRLRVHPRGILVAALLHEITGRPEKARMAFESVRRAADGGDPEEAAAAFYLGERDRVRFDRELSRFPTAAEPITRTVLCYLEGTRLERRGDVDEARRYYVRTVTEDPSRYWPSVLAERRLRDWVPPSPQPSPP
jgi:tetratricopeptide (TPR) repeat protein